MGRRLQQALRPPLRGLQDPKAYSQTQRRVVPRSHCPQRSRIMPNKNVRWKFDLARTAIQGRLDGMLRVGFVQNVLCQTQKLGGGSRLNADVPYAQVPSPAMRRWVGIRS